MKVFYQVTGMSTTRLSEGTTSNTVLTLTGLSLGSYSGPSLWWALEQMEIMCYPVITVTQLLSWLVMCFVNIGYTYMFYIVQIFHSSHPFQPPSSTSIMVSWTPTLVSPISYRVGYSCQLIYGSSSVQQTDTVNGSLTEYTITSIAPAWQHLYCQCDSCVW